MELSNGAYATGDYAYISTALRANHISMMNTINELNTSAANTGQPAQLSANDSFKLMKMSMNTNALLLSLMTRHQFVENEMVKLGDKVKDTGELTEVIKKMADNSSGGRGGGTGKPVSEYKAVQQLKMFSGDRAKFRDWNDKLLNALAQVKHSYRDSLKRLKLNWRPWTVLSLTRIPTRSSIS